MTSTLKIKMVRQNLSTFTPIKDEKAINAILLIVGKSATNIPIKNRISSVTIVL